VPGTPEYDPRLGGHHDIRNDSDHPSDEVAQEKAAQHASEQV